MDTRGDRFETLSERLARLFGPEVEPAISLAPLPDGASASDLVAELLRAGGVSERYEVRGEIDRGGMGAVLEVWDRELRRPLAMKVALDAKGGLDGAAPDRRRLVRFLEEAQITGQLDHPGIVPVHELGVDEQGRVYFTMRRVRGRDLREVFHCVQFELDGWTTTRALTVLLRVCETLSFAHSRGVLHRDIKPANVMVGAYGEVYLMDWGLARVLGRSEREPDPQATAHDSIDTLLRDERSSAKGSPLVTLDGDVLGTPAYMPPERVRGARETLSPRGDVYSVGALLYHLLAGSAPYFPAGRAVSQMAALQALRAGPPEPLAALRPDLAPELVAITEKAMAHDASQRYPDVQALAADLRAWLEGRVVAAYAQGSLAHTRKWLARNRALSLALASALVLFVGGFAATAWQYRRAELRADESTRNAELASEVSAKVLGLSDLKRLSDLREQAEGLWPALPEREAELRAWLERAEGLLDDLAAHRETLAALEARAAIGAARDVEVEWQLGMQRELVAALEQLALDDPALSVRAEVARRLEFARTIAARSVSGEAAALGWSTAIAGVRSDPRFAGLELRPQLGLLPLGPDPHSGLWEFAHLASGEPARRGADGGLRLDERSGVVLVLIPPGRYLMGAQAADPAAPGYDPGALEDEGPPRHVDVGAFLLSKYELTQAQWSRATGNNPSAFHPDRLRSGWSRDGREAGLLHPVEQVSWFDCARTLARLDLRIPRESWWEYAARAGSSSAWWSGDEVESLQGVANVADLFAAGGGGGFPDHEPNLDDGFACHAPVGSLAPNPFGLHDVIGNVIEWCADDVGGELAIVEVGAQRQPRRGGGWVLSARFARSACRNRGLPSFLSQSLGVRPARELR